MSQNLTEMLLKYDLYHCSIIENGKVQLNVNYNNELVKVLLIRTFNGKVDNIECSFKNDKDFQYIIFPKIIIRFFSKNFNMDKRIIMGTPECGTYYIERTDDSESLTVRNCSLEVMNMLKAFEEECKRIKATPTFSKVNISFSQEDVYSEYIKYNIALIYASYRKNFIDRYGKLNFFDYGSRRSFLEKENRNEESNLENLIILDLARYAYKIGFSNGKSYNVWDEIKSLYTNDQYIERLCDKFKEVSLDEYNIFTEALICANYERCNEGFIYENKKIIEEAMIAVNNGIYNGINNFVSYFHARARYYKLLKNSELETVCNNFLNSNKLILRDEQEMTSVSTNKVKKESIIFKLNEINQKNRPDFSTMINEPLLPEEEFSRETVFVPDNKEQIIHDAEEQAKKIMEVLKERDQIKKDAEEFAKIIIKEQKERKKIISDAEEFAKQIFKEQQEKEKLKRAAEEQARIIINLQKENELLKSLANDNARSIFARELKHKEELKLREVKVDVPIKNSDIVKINSLLTALYNVKDLDFAINHPTVLQTLYNLEDKIVTYLVTHKNIVPDMEKKEETKITTFEQDKTPRELIEIIRKTYNSSRIYENEGKHTLINIAPTVDQKYRVTLYSISGNYDDLLTEVYFNDNDFTETVIKEICEIYTKDSIIVASKTDNIPKDKADYLVIDNKDNAIKFIGCDKEIIEIAKAYL